MLEAGCVRSQAETRSLYLRVSVGSENEMPLNSLIRSPLFPLCCWLVPGGPWPQDDHLTNPIKPLNCLAAGFPEPGWPGSPYLPLTFVQNWAGLGWAGLGVLPAAGCHVGEAEARESDSGDLHIGEMWCPGWHLETWDLVPALPAVLDFG